MKMKKKQHFLKERIEDMRRTRMTETGELIGDVASREHLVSAWAETPAEALLNTALAIRQRWKETVEPRLAAFKKNYPSTRTVYDLRMLVDSMNEYDFCKNGFGMHITETPNRRYKMLKDMIAVFIKYQEEKGFSSDKEAMKDWAEKCNLSNLKNDIIGRLPNVGLATVQNLRICMGMNTLKPDVHIKNALKEIGLGNDADLCDLVSELTGYSPLELDQIFWHWDREISKKK